MNDLVGTYSVYVKEEIVWGGTSKILYNIGTIAITKLSKNRVQLRGLISTQGELVDGTLYLDSETNADAYGYLTTTYSAQFAGGIITIWAKTSGQLASTLYGSLYPYSSLCYFEGKKVE